MRILHIGKYYPPVRGGIEKVSFDIIESLNKMGYQADILCFNNSKRTEVEIDRGYRVYRSSIVTSAFSSPLSLSIFESLKKIFKEYDIIHLHVPNPMGALALQSIPFKGKIVVHWHSDIIKQRLLKKIYRPLQDKLLRRADKIIVTSPNYLEGSDCLKNYKQKCEIIPLGISNEDFPVNEKFRKKLNDLYLGKKVILSIGRLIYYKGFEYLIDAAKKLPDDYIVLIGGTGILKDQLNNQIVDNHLESRVKLLGDIPFEHLGEYYRRADAYCMPSTERSEAFGVVLIEAMSFGCPIISTNIGGSGVPWVNQDGQTGIVVETKDSASLANGIMAITKDHEIRNGYAQNSRKRYDAEFTKEKMVKRTLQLYKDLLNN